MASSKDRNVIPSFKSIKRVFKGKSRSPVSRTGGTSTKAAGHTVVDGGKQGSIHLTVPPTDSTRSAASDQQANVPFADGASEDRAHLSALGTGVDIYKPHDNATPTNLGSWDGAQFGSMQIQGYGANFFTGAHVAISNSTMIDSGQSTENIPEAFKCLGNRRIPGAEVDSSARQPVPYCHPNTRKQLRKKISAWLDDSCRKQSMIWILGPAGVGKSAIAQTIAEHCKAIGRLGAAFFFSRLNDRHDPLRVVPTLAYQLAVQLPDYKRLIIQQLTDDITILEKDLRSQFRILIIEPLTTLRDGISNPLLIVLDGLDECNGHDAQCEFITLITAHVQQMSKFPVLWLICSRPEWHLKRMLRRVDIQQNCLREQMSVDDPEAQQDVIEFLRDGFNDIRERFWDMIDVDDDKPWPAEAQLGRLATAASGLFIFASTVLKFIGGGENPEIKDHGSECWGTPITRLELCLSAVGNSSGTAYPANPLQTLDLLYQQILSIIPSNVLPTTMLILGFRVFRPENLLRAQDISNFFFLDQGSFYNSLRLLHSVLEIPTPAQAAKQHLQFYHGSFGDFLRDPGRSGKFYLNEAKFGHDIAPHLFRWYNRTLERWCKLEGSNPYCSSNAELTWGTGGTDYENNLVLDRLGLFIDIHRGLETCLVEESEYTRGVVAEISQVHFCHQPRHPSYGTVIRLAEWLHSLGDRNHGLVRLAPNCETDRELLEKYGFPMMPEKFPTLREGYYFYVLSLHQDGSAIDYKPIGMYFLGHGTRTCLILATP